MSTESRTYPLGSAGTKSPLRKHFLRQYSLLCDVPHEKPSLPTRLDKTTLTDCVPLRLKKLIRYYYRVCLLLKLDKLQTRIIRK